jgi:aerotaxis receptor
MKSIDTPPGEGGDAPMALEELFVSRTDRRGVIQAGNTVFKRMAGYGWDRLIGAPHKLIRHPDMPAGLFRLFWERLQDGRKAGAYVRNRCADGRSYWVFALAMPTDDGYVSVRLKPTGTMLAQIQPLYEALRRRERDDSRSPEASRDALLAGLTDLGYPSYDDFMAAAAETEFSARERGLKRSANRAVLRGQTLAAAIGSARANASRIGQMFEEIRGVPTNIRILAAQLEQGGGPIGVISTNHTTLSEEMLAGVAEFQAATGRTSAAINEALFVTCASALLDEVADTYLRADDLPPGFDAVAETLRMQSLARRCAEEADKALGAVAAQARVFAKLATGVKRHVAGLDVTRIMCKIENARLSDKQSGLTEIIDNLEAVQARISVELAEIERASLAILTGAHRHRAAHAA